MATIATMPQEVQTFLASLSPEEAEQIIRDLHVPAPMAPVAVRTGKKYRNKKAKQAGGPKRPLNSWMAFRSMSSPPVSRVSC